MDIRVDFLHNFFQKRDFSLVVPAWFYTSSIKDLILPWKVLLSDFPLFMKKRLKKEGESSWQSLTELTDEIFTK